MPRSGRTVLVFAVYLWALGGLLVLVPNWWIGLFGIPPTTDVWVRVVGMLALILGYYYLVATRADLRPLIRSTVHARLAVPLFFAAFVLTGLAPPVLLLFGAIDAAAALWTGLALRSEAG